MTGRKYLVFVMVMLLLMSGKLTAQSLQQFLADNDLATYGIRAQQEVREFYRLNGYRFYWSNNQSNRLLIREYILHADVWGLVREDYQPDLLAAYESNLFTNPDAKDSTITELKFSAAAIHFLHDVLLGNAIEPVAFNGLHYTPACINIADLLNNYLVAGKFSLLLIEQESKSSEYLAVKKQMVFFLQKLKEPGYADVQVKSAKLNYSNQALVKRLDQLGFSTDTTLNEQQLKKSVMAAQSLFGLLNDAVLRLTTLEAFNLPLATRVMELSSTLNCLRWLSCIKRQGHLIVVNIPSANLLLYEEGKPVLESRVIVGKRSTHTPTLCSKITEVILYPYWNVPAKIATKELLPIIKRHPAFLDENNYQVLSKAGKRLNALNVDWESLSSTNFPYIIRQSTGCDNSLGIVKLNFYNPYDVYLHDTPGKYLFSLNKRYFSHGCMRLEKAIEVAHYLLKENSIAIDTIVEKGCLKNQSPITVQAVETIPVFVLYHTAWFNAEGRLTFHEDVYNKLRR